MFASEDALKILRLLAANRLPVWLVGGWGIDALLGRQTRSHKDLDLFILVDDVRRFCVMLEGEGYQEIDFWEEDQPDFDHAGNRVSTAFILRDSLGHELDLHAFRLDNAGNGIPAWKFEGELVLPSEYLSGTGFINGVSVQCIKANLQINLHVGYTLPSEQIKDLQLLHEKFGVDYPESMHLSF